MHLYPKALLKRQVVYNRQFWMVFGTFFSFGFCAYLSNVHLVPHATDMGITPSEAAKILSTIGAAVILGRIGMGSLGDRIGSRQALVLCFSLMSLAFFCLVARGGKVDALCLCGFSRVYLGWRHPGTAAACRNLRTSFTGRECRCDQSWLQRRGRARSLFWPVVCLISPEVISPPF